MNRFEILDRMEEILNEKVRSVIPGMINCYLIEAPISKRHGVAIDVHITARGLIWNDYLGGVARTYQVEQLFLYHYNQGSEEFITTPEMWERFDRMAQRETEEMLLKLTKMIKEHIKEEKAWKKCQLANYEIRRAKMGILSQIDAELQKDLLNFVKEQDEKSKNGKVVFGDYLLNDLLKMLISGKCKITGTLTDHGKGKLYVEYSFKDGDT